LFVTQLVRVRSPLITPYHNRGKYMRMVLVTLELDTRLPYKEIERRIQESLTSNEVADDVFITGVSIEDQWDEDDPDDDELDDDEEDDYEYDEDK
jgi:hypothetical protein